MQRRVRILHRRRLVLANSSQRNIQTNAETSHAPCLTLRLKKGEDVVHPDWALDVTDDATARVVKELDPDLCDTTTRTGTAEDLRKGKRGGCVSTSEDLALRAGGIVYGPWSWRRA